jgi:fermentation-respiration switch protein FrsA (DUF1100 family)
MIRVFVVVLVTRVCLCLPAPGRSQSAPGTSWADYVAGEHDVFPNITYGRPGLPPILTIHGDKDNFIPYSQAQRLHTALDKAGVPNKLLTVPGGGHDGFSRQVLIDSFTAIRQFLHDLESRRRDYFR